jgi:hypothetical protein
MRIKIEDYYGNDIVELRIKKELFKLHGDIVVDDTELFMERMDQIKKYN